MRLNEYLAYHRESMRIGDVDPAHAMLKYVVKRFELNQEQALWLCILYGLTYNGASVYYVYNEAPDFENVNIPRLDRWWYSVGRERTVFTTDRRWCRSRNQFVPAVESYQKWIGAKTQAARFAEITTGATPEARYNQIYKSASQLFTMGQFSLFLYVEALATVGGLDLIPTDLDLNQAWSCRNGLCYAYGLDQFVTDGAAPTPAEGRIAVAEAWADLRSKLQPESSVWNLETVLCAFRKNQDGKRYIGSYIDRQATEIAKMRYQVKDGVAWEVLTQYRQETYAPEQLVENTVSWDTLAVKGLPDRWKQLRVARTNVLLAEADQ